MAIDTLAAKLAAASDDELATWSRSQARDEEAARLTSGSESDHYRSELARSGIYAAERARRGWGW